MGSGSLVWGNHLWQHPRSPHGQQSSTGGLRQQCGCRGGVKWQNRQVLSGGARSWRASTAQRASQRIAQTSGSADRSRQHTSDQSGGQRSQASADAGSAATVRPGSNGSEVEQTGDGRNAAHTAAPTRAAGSDVPKLEMLSEQDFGRWAWPHAVPNARLRRGQPPQSHLLCSMTSHCGCTSAA